MFETPDGIIDISGYNDQQKSAFFEKYPDAKQVESDSPSIEELASMGEDREFSDLVSYAREEQVVEPENAEEWASTLAKQKKYYNNNYPKAPSVKPLSETLPEEEEIDPFDPFGIYKEKEELQVEAARQSGSMSDIGQQTFVLDAPEPVSEEREIELGAPSAKTPKDFYNKYDLNVATSDANMYYYDKEPAPDLAYEKSSDWFVKKYYPNIKGLPNKLDLQGHLNKLGITKDFYKKDTEGGFKYVPSAQAGVKRVFSGEGFEAEEFQKISKELELEIHLNNYIQELHEKNTAKEFYKDYEKNPKKYDSFKTMDLAYNSFVEENGGLIPAFDTSILDLWKKNNFTSLNKYKEDLVKKEEEYYNKTLKDGTAKSALDKISNWVEYKTYGAMENVGVLGDLFTGAMLDVTGIDPRYMNRSISSKNLVDISDKKQKHFVSLGGLKAKVGEEEYIKGQDGTIYNVANSLPISGKVSDKQYQRINSIIDKVGKYDVEYSGYGLSVHGGRMLGNLLADVALVKGLGKVRYAASSKYINRTNAIRKAKGLKPINLQARNLKTGKFAKGSTKGTFGKNLAVDIRTYETTLYYGTSGYSKGYSSTFNQAKQAGLTDSEAEKLALIAAPMTSVIYGSTGPLNPRIPLLDKIDDIFMKAGVAKQAVSDYKNKGVIGFVESFKRGVSNFGKEVYKTGTAISKEIGEEVIQEGSEVYVVNPKINEIASQEFLTQEMTADDLRNTAILSSTAAGMTNVNLRSAVGGFSMSPENRLSNLHKLSENIDYSQKVLNHFVTRGEITQEQADDIIDQAKAIKSYAPKAPAWMVNDPAAFIDAAIKGSQIEKLEAEKKNLDEQATFEIDERIEALKEDKKNIIDSAAGRAVKEQTDVIKKKTDKIESFSDPEKMIEFLEAKAKKEGKEYNIKTKIADLESDGFMIDDDGTIIINEKVAVETQAISVASHELLHKILKSEFANNKEMARIVDEFKQILKDKGLFDTIDERMQKNYRDRGVDVDNLKNADEYFTALSDMIGKNQVSRDQLQDSVLMELGRKIVKIFKTRFGLKNARFETGQDVFDFIKDYQKNIQKGKLTKQAELKLKEFVPGGTDRSRSILKDINNLVPKEVKTKQDFQDAKVFNPIYEATLPGGAIYNYVNSRSTSREEAEITLEGVVDRLINFDPAAVRKTAGGDPITFGEFLFANARFSKLDAKKKLAIESERRAESLDTEEARQVAEPVAETTTTEAPRVEYQNLVEASVLPAEMVSKVKDKILLITKTLKSRIDAATSINKTVTPLMSEIKKEIGKQADIEFKKMLGAKRGGELRNNFLKLKKPILENMTTTWLMQGMPFAIQKSVDGKFTSDWEGKKIDRESVGTDKAGRTSGAQLVRRLPNAANKITDEQFLTYMFKGDEVIRGRKEALSKGLAEEYALDVYREQLLDPESEIRKAFIENQERIGVEIAENTIQEFFRQAERGNVKRSVSIPIDELRGEVKVIIARIKKKGSDITNVIDVENSEIIDEELKKKKLSQMAIDLIVHGFGNNLIDFEKQRRYVEGILSNPIIPEYIKKGFKTIDKNSDIKIRKAFAESVTDFAADLDPKVIELLGVDFLGFINRVLDPAAKKIDEVATQKAMDEYFRKNGKKGKGLTVYLKDENGENITGDFYKEFLNISNLSGKTGDLPSDIDMSKVRPMNTSISNGLFDRINRILNNKKGKNYDYSKLDAEGKKAELAKFVPEIEEANKHNKKLFKYLIKKLVNSNIPDIHFLQLLQLQTQAVKGFRALTALKYWTITDGPMGSPKGEHLADNAGTMEEIAELRYSGLKGPALDAKIDEILEYHDQWISARKTLDLVDAIGGVTNKNKDKRILLLPKSEVKEVFTMYGDPATGLIDKRSNNIEKVNKIRKGVLNNQKNVDLEKALSNSRKRSYSENPKGISVYDFDDTLAFSKSQIIVKKDGKTFKINAAQFAKQGETLLAEGAEFDFSEFNKVVKGQPGPLIPRIQKAIDKFGNNNIFILTARPVASESAIHAFMKGLGIDIPRANITGLANSTAQAKADWMVGKVAEGFNDFYFVDDAIKNVKAVKDVLETFDVKSKVQQAIANRKRSMSSDLNEMIERNTGVRAETTYSKVLARKKGAKKGKFKFFVPYSAEDFKGLTSYTLAGKGKQGEADQRFFDRNLILPYTRGIAAMEGATQALKNDYKNLLNMFGLKKQLPKKIGDTDFTTDQAVRVYLWDQQGFDIPNISKRDQNKLSKLVAKDPDLVGFAEGLMAVSKKDNWVKPKEHWDVGSILKDLNDITDNVNRKEYLAEFIENVDEMFDKTTLNKLEAIYGTNYVEALQDSIRRMKSGSNSPRSAGKIEQKWLNWVNNSVGTIMFFNRRSALLQMLSFTNFINWSDNNPAKAAAAFANQPLYWKKWVEIFNSDKLKERRGGLKSDIQESEIANQAKNSKDKASAVISYLLKIGFTPTQIADSFAIATGGATFLINRTKKYEKQGFSKKEAEAKAFEDFGRISDETQQSGDPMLISQQQASHLGRLVLAFQNTPMQYTRLMKKAGKDIYNRRGSDVENLSKIAYYGFVQNLIFSSLQSALFALIPGFDDEEEEDAKVEDKVIRTANSMVDTILRGTGLAGAVISTLKNAIMRYQKEDKKGYTADHTYTMIELANISPPIGSKLRKVYSAIQTKKFNQAAIDEMGYDLTIDGKFNPSPNYEIIANVSSAVGNLPLDRLLSEVKSINEAFDSRNTSYQRLALALGWRTWGVNVKNEEQDLIKVKAKAAKKEAGKRKAKETKKIKKKRKLDRVRSMTDEEMKALRAASSKRKEEARQRILAEREKSSK
jgi:hypothetical protein